MPLSGKQRHHLRALAHHLEPVVQVGHEGVTDAVVLQVEAALAAHELIKVRLGTECPEDRDGVAAALSSGTKSDVAQTIGHVIVLYRRRPKKPKVALPTRAGDERKVKTKGSKGKRPGASRSGKQRYKLKQKRNESRRPPRAGGGGERATRPGAGSERRKPPRSQQP